MACTCCVIVLISASEGLLVTISRQASVTGKKHFIGISFSKIRKNGTGSYNQFLVLIWDTLDQCSINKMKENKSVNVLQPVTALIFLI